MNLSLIVGEVLGACLLIDCLYDTFRAIWICFDCLCLLFYLGKSNVCCFYIICKLWKKYLNRFCLRKEQPSCFTYSEYHAMLPPFLLVAVCSFRVRLKYRLKIRWYGWANRRMGFVLSHCIRTTSNDVQHQVTLGLTRIWGLSA